MSGRKSIGKYDLEKEIGRGGMGEVHLAINRESGLRVAIKLSHNNGWGADKRFTQEAQLLERLRGCPNLVNLVEHGEDNGVTFIAMELLQGQSLWKHIVSRGGGRLSEAEALEIMRQTCLGVAHAHERGVLHRDLKPDNIFVTSTIDGKLLVKVIDFGLAKDTAAPHMTAVGVALGTPTYMAPEQRKNARNVNARADVFALGCILIRMLAEQDIYPHGCELGVIYPAFPKPNHVSQEVWNVAMRAANPDLVHRQASVKEFWEQLENAAVQAAARVQAVPAPVVRLPVAAAPAAAPKPQAAPPQRQQLRGRKFHRGTAIFVSMMVALASVVAFIMVEEEPPPRRTTHHQVSQPARRPAQAPPITVEPPANYPLLPTPPPPRPSPPHPVPRVAPRPTPPHRPTIAAHPLPPVVGVERSSDGRGYTIPARSRWGDADVVRNRPHTCAGLRNLRVDQSRDQGTLRAFHEFCDGY